MSFPFFYSEHLEQRHNNIKLDEPNSRHIIQVLRMKNSEKVQLTNGKGLLAVATISDANKKACELNVDEIKWVEKQTRKVGIGISPVKNASRFEWFLEKATELGVSEIFPLVCQRTVKEHFRFDRMQAICVSAMLQSQQAWLPILHPPQPYKTFVDQVQDSQYHQKWIAHCDEYERHDLVKVLQPGMKDSLILIGPEGDFTPEEIMQATANQFSAVALGTTRLRTETAAITAAGILMLC